ncbi:hypothetical protein B0T20DRAFT_104369 [Sordaria brevicollis]|uniref:Uncharacterized protein n=1 Tax=Sordaria brevicollis TaxID=83679 RepID=A0AAE0U2G5_SORBR|nr:hypothetical protein B0T20DRAFT_104369 [Sordaria brevicollis]
MDLHPSHDAGPADVLRLVPIPRLLEDFSNWVEWEHATFFHLSYYNLAGLVLEEVIPAPPRDYSRAELRRRHHAYAIIFSGVQNLMRTLTEDSSYAPAYVLRGWYVRDYNPAALYRHLRDMRFRIMMVRLDWYGPNWV